jgi:hypothetical protein
MPCSIVDIFDKQIYNILAVPCHAVLWQSLAKCGRNKRGSACIEEVGCHYARAYTMFLLVPLASP